MEPTKNIPDYIQETVDQIVRARRCYLSAGLGQGAHIVAALAASRLGTNLLLVGPKVIHAGRMSDIAWSAPSLTVRCVTHQFVRSRAMEAEGAFVYIDGNYPSTKVTSEAVAHLLASADRFCIRVIGNWGVVPVADPRILKGALK